MNQEMIKKIKITKSLTATLFLCIYIFSQILLFVQNTQAAVNVQPPATGACPQNNGTGSANNYIYQIGTFQITLTASEINPGRDDIADVGATTGNARATNGGRISSDGDVIGNIFSIIPPTGTSFVILSGKEDSSNPSNLAQGNASIFNAFSQDSTNGGATSPLGISVGVITTGTAGIGRAIVAIARDTDSTGTTAGNETYPKSGTGSNTVTISITGLGLSIPPSGDSSLSGTLSTTIDPTPPTGIGKSGSVGSLTISSAIPGFNSSFNLCTVSSSSTSSSSTSSSSSSGSTTNTSSSTSFTVPTAGACTQNTSMETIYDLGTL